MLDIIDIGNLDDFDPDSVDSSEPLEMDASDEESDQFNDADRYADIEEINKYGLDFENSEIENIHSLITNPEESISDSASLHDGHYSSSNIAFTGNGRCRVCNCGGWAGFGDTCANCGHFYNKHI